MSQLTQRAYPRTAFNAPIQYTVLNSNKFHSTQMINYSAGGICYEADEQLDPEEQVCIVMKNYTPGQFGPEGFRSYLTRISWIQPDYSNTGNNHFIAGAKIVARSHEVLTADAERPQQICDLCGALMPVCQLHCTESKAQLCGQCCKHLDSIPQGKIRKCLERFMVGNVI